MKTCPICKARCFDDMEVCYGCMHRFDVGGSHEFAERANAACAEDANTPTVEEAGAVAPAGASAICESPADEVAESAPETPMAPGSKSTAFGSVRSASRAKKARPQVFGAALEDDGLDVASVAPSEKSPHPQSVLQGAAVHAELARKVAPGKEKNTGKEPRPKSVPVAITSLGNGYRLVITLERE